ncbi:MAG: VWA domain-containing protein [Thermoanaerobaculia bacterium]
MRDSLITLALVAATLVAAALCSATVAMGQEEPQETFAEELEVTEVLLDVLVTDGQGRVILGLGKDDFVVEEAGEPVEITGVTFYSSRELLSAPEEVERLGLGVDLVPEDRYFILFIQDQRLRGADTSRLLQRQLEGGREARQWVREQMLPRDWMAVVSYLKKLKVHQDFTRNLEEIDAAIGRAIQGEDPGNIWPSRRPDSEAEVSLLAGLPAGLDLRQETPTIYEGLELLARAAGAVRGRKILLFFGVGFGELASTGRWQPDRRYYPSMIQALNDNNVAVYTMDLTPLGTRHSFEESLENLAGQTGGQIYRYFTSFTTPLEQISDANGGYYLLSYRATHPAGETGYQKVKVSTRNKELKVKARQGYLYGDHARR